MKYGFVKAAAATPKITIANPSANAAEISAFIKKSSALGAELLVFPELCVTGYTCGDLFLSDVLKNASEKALEKIVAASKKSKALIFVGAPLWHKSKLYSAAVAIQSGKVLGVVPKTALPSYSEFYELRHFSCGKNINDTINICGAKVPFSANIIFSAAGSDNVKVSAEICEDMFIASPPSIRHAQAGATIIVNLSASNELVGKSDYRKTLIKAQSGRLSAGYVYASAGEGESVSDIIFSGHRIIAENGEILADSELFESGLTVSEIDVEKLAFERRKLNVFENESSNYINVEFKFNKKKTAKPVRQFSQTPFVPKDNKIISSRAELILQIQSRALAQRLKLTNSDAVIGVSGGLDSCLALLVILRSYKILNRDKENIIAVTMPGPGTSAKTLANVEKLGRACGIKIRKIPILKSVENHLADINHKGSKDIAYENAQARERTQILMDIANAEKGLVVGTGDLSEIALGWNTYNGDHMSMYGVNCGVPKTLVKYLVAYESGKVAFYKNALNDILNTEISPELLPHKNGKISQKTEKLIGPYELHDFFLYYTVRFGQTPDKILFEAAQAFAGKYKKDEIKKWLNVFIKRFFANQFKRNCVPDGVKVGTIALSPRGDWRMPSEASAEEWLNGR
ncbi:Glutamine-dependent NAD(+) synthetase [Endomicrobium proavitum]|uniref:Glutamine-dependent NAD(+) synthetase n=2 Tax=Endomicrobium proavitum TaxID=1408281 RepID=A0A0G3WKL7_9BACT|nr:Glutamine-dependent NAD(+) synthetase [Endomicrobium proavitum]